MWHQKSLACSYEQRLSFSEHDRPIDWFLDQRVRCDRPQGQIRLTGMLI